MSLEINNTKSENKNLSKQTGSKRNWDWKAEFQYFIHPWSSPPKNNNNKTNKQQQQKRTTTHKTPCCLIPNHHYDDHHQQQKMPNPSTATDGFTLNNTNTSKCRNPALSQSHVGLTDISFVSKNFKVNISGSVGNSSRERQKLKSTSFWPDGI